MTNFAAMKQRGLLIGWFVLLALVACHNRVETRHGMSLQDTLSPELLFIDSLLWHQPDSAMMHLGHYFKPNGDNVSTIATRTEYNRRYAYLLLAELLFKNNYPQTCRENLLRSVDYFDSLLVANGADTRDVSLPFLAARAHYINGVGYYEQDIVIDAYTEYICALDIMENHFPVVETVCTPSLPIPHIPRFMMLTYCRLGSLFSDQYMQEPAIYCFKKALAFKRSEPLLPDDHSNLLYWVGLQYDKLQQWDSALYYYNEALQQLQDTNNLIFSTLISNKANLNYRSGKGLEPAVSDLKRVTAQRSLKERPYHFFLIGQIYYTEKQYDSALVYLMPTFEPSKDIETKSLTARYLHDIYQSRCDTLKAAQYAVYLAEHTDQERVGKARVSALNELFQSYLQEKQEAASHHEWQKSIKTVLVVVLTLTALMIVAIIQTRRKTRKRIATHEAEAQQRLNEVMKRHDETERDLQTKVKQAAQHTQEVLEQRVMTIYRSENDNRLKQILAEFEAVYPKALSALAAAHPELSETERHIAVLNFLRFRSKEEAELMGFTEYTTLKYRSNLKKKVGSNPIEALFEAGKI